MATAPSRNGDSLITNRIAHLPLITTERQGYTRSTLSPVAYREAAFPSLRLTRASRVTRRLATLMVVLFVVMVIAMLFAPWQQTIGGSGSVVAFTPLDRRQVIEAPIKGRIVRWGEGIRENTAVTKGQVICEIEDMDPLFLSRLEDQLATGRRQLEAARERVTATQAQLAANRTVVESYTDQVNAFLTVRTEIVAAADEYIDMAENKLDAERKKLIAALAAREQTEADYKRQQELYDEGFASQSKMQLAELKYREGVAKADEAAANVAAAQDEVDGKRREREAKDREADAKIESAEAMQRKAGSDVSKLQAELAKANGDVTKAEKELLDMEIKLARQKSQVVTAPKDGRILKLIVNQGGEYVKEGDPLFEIVPSNIRNAVQVYVDGNDVPLIEPGRHVRLQLEGWPAVQFSGWPSVAVGTFGGEVALVDSTDDGTGRFRVLVLPDPKDQPWPTSPYLRQVARANAWILLDRVTLGYEIWRRLNGFPPALQSRTEKSKAKKSSLKSKK